MSIFKYTNQALGCKYLTQNNDKVNEMEQAITNLKVQSQAVGKLYVAGEYAVVEPGHPSVLVAVDRSLTVTVVGLCEQDVADIAKTAQEIGKQTGKIQSEGRIQDGITWHREQGIITANDVSDSYSYVLAAAQTVEEVVAYKGVLVRPFDVHISSQLDSQLGKKYGLGSSAAVVVATVKALLEFYGIELSDLAIYKLAYLAAGRASSYGSGGDIAASLFGGCIRFCSPDQEWVCQWAEKSPVVELIERPWPGLAINRLNVLGEDSRMRLLVGWTGCTASTPSLVASVKEGSIDGKRQAYENFLKQSDDCVNALVAALQKDDFKKVSECINRDRELLLKLSQLTDTEIETQALHTLVEAAHAHGAPAKSSGAGGGDCGIAVVDATQPEQAHKIEDAWASQGIEPLNMGISQQLAFVQDWSDEIAAEEMSV